MAAFITFITLATLFMCSLFMFGFAVTFITLGKILAVLVIILFLLGFCGFLK